MGRILLFMIAASIAWYLVRSAIGRSRPASRSVPDPNQSAPEVPPRDVPQERAGDQEVREAKFRDL